MKDLGRRRKIKTKLEHIKKGLINIRKCEELQEKSEIGNSRKMVRNFQNYRQILKNVKNIENFTKFFKNQLKNFENIQKYRRIKTHLQNISKTKR